jgi:hypothetical protein
MLSVFADSTDVLMKGDDNMKKTLVKVVNFLKRNKVPILIGIGSGGILLLCSGLLNAKPKITADPINTIMKNTVDNWANIKVDPNPLGIGVVKDWWPTATDGLQAIVDDVPVSDLGNLGKAFANAMENITDDTKVSIMFGVVAD